ncbi:M4 family metallopeptidase [Kitasatospora sp. NPDC056327]|uniref:M4 family metallopeptidase n=1 Tax=Kitasatospora sp. NPDC056327 TaxID=3345785 RepID=UPI0035E0CCDF
MRHRSRSPRLLGIAIAVVVGLGPGVAPAVAGPVTAPAGGPAAEADPVPGLVAGGGTDAPQLVTGLADAAPGAGPADAARAHLTAHRDRYRVDPAQLVEAGVERAADGRSTVRFAQRHAGLPVLGAVYLVHLAGEGDARRVESVGGKYFTGLTVPAVQAVPDEVLRGVALGAGGGHGAPAGAAEDHGLVVLPDGAGRLVRHFTVRGSGPAAAPGTAREVYVDATTGQVALDHGSRAPERAAATTGAAAAGVEPATGTAPDAFGRSVTVNVGRLPDGTYQLTDATRAAVINTYDANGRDEYDFKRGIPDDLRPVSSATPAFPASSGASGATDAHLNAAAVLNFYRERLGRGGIDGRNGSVVSVVNPTSDGQPLRNAFWDGEKMIYSGPSEKEHPFSVALDVAGHEMTHGVVEHTAGLILMGQAGALDEAVADYFGNAIEVTTRGIPMDDPRAALLGESLCRTGTPESCAGRRLDDRRTTVDDYVGVAADTDSAGVHLNSTIVGGALWDLRRTLDPLVADRLVYRALSEYLTPADDFVDARNAVLAAGRANGLDRAQLRKVAAAFDAHGIKQGWERRIGTDSRTLLRDVSSPSISPDVAGGRWVASTTPESGARGLLAVFTGPVGGSAGPVRLSEADGRAHGWAATDGTTAAWVASGPGPDGVYGSEVLARPLDGGPVRSLRRTSSQYLSGVRVSGGTVAFVANDFATGRSLPVVAPQGGPATEIPLPDGHGASGLFLRDGLLAWTETWEEGERTVYAVTVYSLAAGKVISQRVAGGANTTATIRADGVRLSGGRLYWVETPMGRGNSGAIRSAAADGSGGVTDLLAPGTAGRAGITGLTVTDRAITFADFRPWEGGAVTNAQLPKIWQLPLAGGTPQRFSCNRGGQYMPVADRGTRVLWLDATAGRTDLVVRERAAGTC